MLKVPQIKIVSVAGVPAGNDRMIKVAWLYASCEEKRMSAMIRDLGMGAGTGVIKDREKRSQKSGAGSQEGEDWKRSKENENEKWSGWFVGEEHEQGHINKGMPGTEGYLLVKNTNRGGLDEIEEGEFLGEDAGIVGCQPFVEQRGVYAAEVGLVDEVSVVELTQVGVAVQETFFLQVAPHHK